MRFPTPDAAFRWALEKHEFRAHDPGRVSLGRSAGRVAFDVANDARARILATLQHLGEKEQAALVLRAHGYSWREIGPEIGCSSTTARRLAERSREVIAGRLRAIGLVEREEAV